MAFNIFRDFYKQSVNVSSVAPRWRGSDVVPVNFPGYPLRSLSVSQDYSNIMRIINKLKIELWTRDLFFLRCSMSHIKYWLQKIWMLYSEKYDNYILKAPLSLGDVLFPRMKLNNDMWTSRRLVLSVVDEEVANYKDYKIVGVGIHYSFNNKDVVCDIDTGDVSGLEVGIINPDGVPVFRFNIIYLINNGTDDISSTDSVYCGFKYVVNDWCVLSLCSPFSEKVLQSVAVYSDPEEAPIEAVLRSIANDLIDVCYKNYSKILDGCPSSRFLEYKPFKNRNDWRDIMRLNITYLMYESYFNFASLRLFAPNGGGFEYFYKWTIPRSPRLWVFISMNGFETVGVDKYVFLPVVLQGSGESINGHVLTPQVYDYNINNFYPVDVGISADELKNNKHVITKKCFIICYAFHKIPITDYSLQITFYLNFDDLFSVLLRKSDEEYIIEHQFPINTSVSYKADNILKLVHGVGFVNGFFIKENGDGIALFNTLVAANSNWLHRTNLNDNFLVVGNVGIDCTDCVECRPDFENGRLFLTVKNIDIPTGFNLYFTLLKNKSPYSLMWAKIDYEVKEYKKGENVIFSDIDLRNKRLVVIISCFLSTSAAGNRDYKSVLTLGLYYQVLDNGSGYLKIIDVNRNVVLGSHYVKKLN